MKVLSTARINLLFTFFIFLLPQFVSLFDAVKYNEGEKLTVLYQAKVSLNGTTNINTFTCNSAQVNNSMEVKLFRLNQKGQIEFEHPTLEVAVSDLDCGGRGINRDLQNTLNAEEHPFIKIRVQSVQLKSSIKSPPSRDPEEVMALTCITISGVERCVDIPVLVSYSNFRHLQICGSIPLAMTEFGLEPPKALMGMIHANDHITVSFDMNVELNKKN